MMAIHCDAHDRELLDTLVAYRDALVDLAARIVHCHTRAEDIVQDIVLKLLESSVGIGVRRPASYLFQMVRNRAIDLVRRTEFENVHIATDEEAILEHESGISLEGTLVCHEELAHVSDALDQLPQRTRRVFEMHRLEGYTQKEIATRFRVSPTLVNFMVHDAHSCCVAALARATV